MTTKAKTKVKLGFEVLHDRHNRLTVRFEQRIGALLDLSYTESAARPWRVKSSYDLIGAFKTREAALECFYEHLGVVTLDKARRVLRRH